MIIDSHLHVPFGLTQPWQPLIEKLLHHMEMHGIDQTCLMTSPRFAAGRYPSQQEMIYQAETITEMVEANPGKFYPLLLICPMLPYDFTLPLIDKYIVNGVFTGVKFFISLEVDDERYDPIYNHLAKHDIPALFHSWYKTTEKQQFESDPRQIANMARKHPKLRILMAHLTGGRLRGIQDIKNLPNVWVDTSGSWPEDGYLQKAIEELGADRILYGSDYPGRSISPQLARIDSIEMDAETRDKILYRNALEFFRKGNVQ